MSAPQLEVTPQMLIDFRKKLLTNENLPEFDARDVTRIQENDALCKRYLKHKKCDIDEAVKFATNSLKWRKEFAVWDVQPDQLPLQLFQENNIFPYNLDKMGAHILMLRVKNYKKDSTHAMYSKKFAIYFAETLMFEKNAKCITVVFDCTDAGIANVDMDIIKFIISLFRDYYPYAMGMIIVHEMPWILQAAWNIIKNILPAEGRSRLKFTNGVEALKEFIDEDNIPQYLGGGCSYVYDFNRDKSYLGDRCPTLPPSKSTPQKNAINNVVINNN